MTTPVAIIAALGILATAIGGHDGLDNRFQVRMVQLREHEARGNASPHENVLRIPFLAGDGIATREPEPAPELTPEPPPTKEPVVAGFAGEVTHYGESYNGSAMGCPPYAAYSSWNTSIVAVGPSRYAEWPCGTTFVISGPAGSITGVRQDACPGCSGTHLDLSESGFEAVCGPLSVGRCSVWIEVLR